METIDLIRKQLSLLTEEEKDNWIISQAKTSSEYMQKSIYKSLCGDKKVVDMPDNGEILDFFDKVKNEDVAVEYETHYVEFDDYGYYHGDWEHDFYDSDYALAFTFSLIKGCHDLNVLGEYSYAFEILDEVIRLKFRINDAPDTDECCEDEYMDLDMAIHEGMLTVNRDNLLKDYVEACINSADDYSVAADKIVSALEMDLFKDCDVSICINISEDDSLMPLIKLKLSEDLEKLRKEHDEKIKREKYYRFEFLDKDKIEHIQAILEYFNPMPIEKKETENSFLRGTWNQITDLIEELSYEPYVDDQLQIDQIYNIIEALMKRGRFDEEPWEVKENILKEIIDNDFYDYYCVYDLMNDFFNALCTTRNEKLKQADIMIKSEDAYLGFEAAKIYHKLEEDDKCAEFYERHLEKDEKPYEFLINYYRDRDYIRAVEIAELAITKCKENLTSFYLLLLQNAQKCGDKEKFRKLMQSAHRKRSVNSDEIDNAFSK